MYIRLLENVILEDNKLTYENQNVLEIKFMDKKVYYDLIDKRINTYKVVITDNSKITDIASIDYNIYEEVVKSELDIIQEHFVDYANIKLTNEDRDKIAYEVMFGNDEVIALIQDKIFKQLEQYM